MKNRVLSIFALSLAAFALPRTAAATPIFLFGGLDSGVGFGSALPNSDAAASQFATALAGLGQTVNGINFESTPTQTISGPVNLGGGVGLGLTNAPGSLITNVPDPIGTFGTTPGGQNNYLEFLTPQVSAGTTTTASATFTFDTPIDAFGAYFTGIGTDTTFAVNFSDGTSAIIPVVGFGNGYADAQFAGFIDPNAVISSVTLTNTFDATNGGWYAVGVDDVRFADSPVPEPASLLLLGSGLIGVARRFRNRRKA